MSEELAGRGPELGGRGPELGGRGPELAGRSPERNPSIFIETIDFLKEFIDFYTPELAGRGPELGGRGPELAGRGSQSGVRECGSDPPFHTRRGPG